MEDQTGEMGIVAEIVAVAAEVEDVGEDAVEGVDKSICRGR